MNHAENLELIQLFEGIRVADARDGLDWMGYHHYGSVNQNFRPIFYGSPVVGIAKTARYLPYEGPVPPSKKDEEARQAYRDHFSKVNSGEVPFWLTLQPGDFVCLDMSETDVGIIGSANALWHKGMGCVGYLLNGAARDVDEMILQKNPCWLRSVANNSMGARAYFHEADIPIAIGGAAIFPGDVVVGDGDGVVVVPRRIARDVAKWARKENVKDRADRKSQYINLGIELDSTVS